MTAVTCLASTSAHSQETFGRYPQSTEFSLEYLGASRRQELLDGLESKGVLVQPLEPWSLPGRPQRNIEESHTYTATDPDALTKGLWTLLKERTVTEDEIRGLEGNVTVRPRLGRDPAQVQQTIDPTDEQRELQNIRAQNPDNSHISDQDLIVGIQGEECKVAQDNFDLSYSKCGGSVDSCPDEESARKLLEAGVQFDSACLSNLAETSRIAGDSSHFAQVLGVLSEETTKGLYVFCGAVILDAARIITNRHCFFDPSLTNPNAHHGALLDGAVRFHVASDPSSSFPVASFETVIGDFPETYGVDDDYVVLRLESSIRDAERTVFEDPTVGESLFLVGHFPFYDHSSQMVDNVLFQERSSPDWYAGLRSSKGTKCKVLAVEQTCFVHSCQSIPGFSGAPLLRISKSDGSYRVSVVGIQSRRQTFGDQCAVDVQDDFNIAVSGLHIIQSTSSLSGE